MEWYDDYLKWDPSEHFGLKRIILPSKSIWTPDLVLQNTADKFYNEEFIKYFKVEISSNGRIIFVPGGKISTSCPLNMQYFPFDFQTCKLIVSMWASACKEARVISNSSKIDLE